MVFPQPSGTWKSVLHAQFREWEDFLLFYFYGLAPKTIDLPHHASDFNLFHPWFPPQMETQRPAKEGEKASMGMWH